MSEVREIPLSRGLVALVDDVDYERVLAVGKWYANPSGVTYYARKNFWRAGRCFSIRMHTLITGWSYVDHRNGNGLDNRRSNLRQASDRQNAQNRGRRSDNTSGFKGVSWDDQQQAWSASICVDSVQRRLGRFSSREEAALAYDAAAIQHFGEFARLNFPKES
jgi:hypothetical protein